MVINKTRYATSGSPKDSYYSGTQILINKLSIKEEPLLAEVEKQLLEKTIRHFFERVASIHKFDSRLLNKIHKYFLNKLYLWAGQYRTVSISKGKTRFAVPKFIPKLMADFDKKIEKENYLIGLKEDEFLKKLAYFKCELIAIHPFREGNGRVIRLFCDLLTLKNNFQLFKFPLYKKFIKKYLRAAEIGVVKADFKPMLQILKKYFRKT